MSSWSRPSVSRCIGLEGCLGLGPLRTDMFVTKYLLFLLAAILIVIGLGSKMHL